ncbi:MAG: GAF domain-containing protein [Anaerolineales bacterium]|jgi:two-component system nitrate/nitrite sensor histidine kinase NarX|nr:GAF domain-containing protein [Anaerolineales bacterium]
MDSELLRARYATFAALSLVFSIYLIAALPWHPLFLVAIAFTTAALLTAVLEFWLRLSLRRSALRHETADPHQLQPILAFQRTILGAISEREVLEATLETGAKLLGASSASFLPYDEFGQSLPTVLFGNVPESALANWTKRLASPAARQVCKNCETRHAGSGCALLPTEAEISSEVHCFPIQIAGRGLGVVNYFFGQPGQFAEEKSPLLISLLDFAAQAIETLRLREQEMSALRYLQTATGPKSDLSALFNNLLENVQKALDTDFALLYIPGGIRDGIASGPLLLAKTRQNSNASIETPDPGFLEGLWKSVQAAGQSISLENVTINRRGMWKVLLAVPLGWQDSAPAGVLVLGSNTIQTFAERQRALLETIAAQLALLLQNARLMVQLEYQAVLDERTRLAREIHDGLAQTLAFLKLQSAQMQNYLAQGEMERLTSSLQSNYRTLSDAYLDARQAIDNLRRVPSSSLRNWLGDVLADFRESAEISVELSAFEVAGDFPPSVQAQLIRIVQESLSNVRKHAQASRVMISVRELEGYILLEVRDNGIGFTPAALESGSRYGLRGMRERSEMIGADFQISSQPGQGTLISLRLPAGLKEEV